MSHDGRETFWHYNARPGGRNKVLTNKAAAYVRMSTEHQQYSTNNQLDVIREYAKRRGLEIVKIYSDEGKSGLNIQGRDSLAQMIQDVQSGETEFSFILVYDISRWGRFQDSDESAFYEYICRQAGITVSGSLMLFFFISVATETPASKFTAQFPGKALTAKAAT